MPTGDIGIDMGTRSSLVFSTGRGMILDEPTVAVYDRNAERIRAIGEEARSMIGHVSSGLELIWPIRQGVIVDYIVLEKMMRTFIGRAMGRHAFLKPRISICVPFSITEIGRKALTEAAYQAGARKVCLVESPVAAAIGAGLDVSRPYGNLVLDIGAGASSAAVISMAGIVVSASVKTGGDSFDEAIMSYIRKNHNLFIGLDMAEDIKKRVGCAAAGAHDRSMEIKGRNVVTGLPKTIVLTSEEVCTAVNDVACQISDMVHTILEKTPPELTADIVDRGILLTGGGALLRGMDKFIEQKTGVSAMTASQPLLAAVIGTGKYAGTVNA